MERLHVDHVDVGGSRSTHPERSPDQLAVSREALARKDRGRGTTGHYGGDRGSEVTSPPSLVVHHCITVVANGSLYNVACHNRILKVH